MLADPKPVEQEHIKVTHYGPINGPEDADHSTSIMITRGKFTRVLPLENHGEVRSLIEKLQKILEECSL